MHANNHVTLFSFLILIVQGSISIDLIYIFIIKLIVIKGQTAQTEPLKPPFDWFGLVWFDIFFQTERFEFSLNRCERFGLKDHLKPPKPPNEHP